MEPWIWRFRTLDLGYFWDILRSDLTKPLKYGKISGTYSCISALWDICTYGWGVLTLLMWRSHVGTYPPTVRSVPLKVLSTTTYE